MDSAAFRITCPSRQLRAVPLEEVILRSSRVSSPSRYGSSSKYHNVFQSGINTWQGTRAEKSSPLSCGTHNLMVNKKVPSLLSSATLYLELLYSPS